MLAAVFALLNFHRDRYFADHLTAALEFMCFTIFYVTLAWPLVLVIIHLTLRLAGSEFSIWSSEWIPLSPGVIALATYFVVRMERTLYNQKWIWAVLKGVAVVL
nr:MAG: hypothetical protein DIU61_19860 [Bacteroidota bacterium]